MALVADSKKLEEYTGKTSCSESDSLFYTVQIKYYFRHEKFEHSMTVVLMCNVSR